MGKFNALDWIAFIILAIGGLNWGLVGFFDFDLVAEIFGEGEIVSRIIYAVVGVAALYLLIIAFTKQSRK